MISIRPAAAQDLQSLFALVSEITNFTSDEKELAREVLADALALEKNDYSLLVATLKKGTIVGFICYGPIPITVHRWDLYWIAVGPKSSRQGIGSLLLQAMEKELGKGVRVYIDTSSTAGYAAARTFYERHDYQPVCLLQDFYRNGDDKIVYCKEL